MSIRARVAPIDIMAEVAMIPAGVAFE